MMYRASSLCGLAAALMIMGSGAGTAVRAQDQNPADHLSDQLANFISVPSPSADEHAIAVEDGWSNPDHLAAPLILQGVAPESLFPLPDDPIDPAGIAEGPTSSQIGKNASAVPRPTMTSWSFDPDDSGAGSAHARSFEMDMPSELGTLSDDSETVDNVDDPPAERSSEPHTFQLSDSVKMKAQPLGGGLGGRVTLTFSFPTAY